MTNSKREQTAKLSASAIDKSLSQVSDTPDRKSALEQEAFDSKAEMEKALIDSLKQDIAERKKYASCIFVLICAWIGMLFALLAAQGFDHWTQFSLSQPVILATIGSTTVDVLGLFYIVTRYLFHSSEHEQPKHILRKRTPAKPRTPKDQAQ
jgi:hypothetical protein